MTSLIKLFGTSLSGEGEPHKANDNQPSEMVVADKRCGQVSLEFTRVCLFSPSRLVWLPFIVYLFARMDERRRTIVCLTKTQFMTDSKPDSNPEYTA